MIYIHLEVLTSFSSSRKLETTRRLNQIELPLNSLCR
jgi:hypothetical protein